jgi:hypothetical protein
MNERRLEPSWWKRPWAPGPLRPTLGVYALLLVPAALGAAFDWSAGLTIALMIPALLLSIRLGQVGARRRGLRSRKETPQVASGLIGAVGAVVVVVVSDTLAFRYFGLLLAGMAITTDLIIRAWWLRFDRRGAALENPLGTHSLKD